MTTQILKSLFTSADVEAQKEQVSCPRPVFTPKPMLSPIPVILNFCCASEWLENLWKKARSISWPHPQKFKRSGLMLMQMVPRKHLANNTTNRFLSVVLFLYKVCSGGEGKDGNFWRFLMHKLPRKSTSWEASLWNTAAKIEVDTSRDKRKTSVRKFWGDSTT